jgi:hypothetical protein
MNTVKMPVVVEITSMKVVNAMVLETIKTIDFVGA